MRSEASVTISGTDGAILERAAKLLEADGIEVFRGGEPGTRFVLGDVTIDLSRREVICSDGSSVRPTTKAFDVLALLASNRGVVMTRGTIVDRGLGQPFIDPRTVDTYVMQLRRRIPGLVIETVRGIGYRIPRSD